jgi:hypothetical protein
VDALFELSDALLCTDMPVKSLADLTLLPEHRRGHGGMLTHSSPRPDVTGLVVSIGAHPLENRPGA